MKIIEKVATLTRDKTNNTDFHSAPAWEQV